MKAPPPYLSVKVHGRAAALCLCEATTRARGEKTVNVEGALARGRVYDWPNKIILQLSVTEMFQVLAVFERRCADLRLEGHGSAHDKALHMAMQGGGFYVKLIQRGRPLVAVPVPAADALRLKSLLYRQILANEPHLGIDGVRALLDSFLP